MRRRVVGTAVAVCCVASLAAAGASPAAGTTGHAARRPSAVPVIVDCLWHPHVRPAGFMLACGDGNSRLTSLHWSKWGTDTARAEGVNLVNDCKPYCAAGTFHAYPVTVRLSDPHPWKKRPTLWHFTEITLTYPGSRPDVYAQTVTLPLWE
ncbi:hypothetical protein ACYF6T_11445 [Streptomyces sp. 7R007]